MNNTMPSSSSSTIFIPKPVGDQDPPPSSPLTLYPAPQSPPQRANRTSQGYAFCFALFIVFVTDDLGDCMGEAKPIAKELEDNWGVRGEFYKIPFIGSQKRLQEQVEQAVASFIKRFDGESNLLLVHYGGHGYVRDEKFYIAMGNNGSLYEIRLKPIREQFLECTADVGIILDACEAAAGSYREYHSHSVEILAACEEGGRTPAVGPKSFSNAILKVLKGCEQDTLSLFELCERLAKGKAYPLEAKPVHRTLKRSLWGSITLRRSSRAPVISDMLMKCVLQSVSSLRYIFSQQGQGMAPAGWVASECEEVEEAGEGGFVVINHGRGLQNPLIAGVSNCGLGW